VLGERLVGDYRVVDLDSEVPPVSFVVWPK
jgi:hypothetical protein